jgi:hypothetical protein
VNSICVVCHNSHLCMLPVHTTGVCSIFATELGIAFHVWKVVTIVLLLRSLHSDLVTFHIRTSDSLIVLFTSVVQLQRFAGWLRELKLKFIQ